MTTVRYLSRRQIERETCIVELYRAGGTLAGVGRDLGVSAHRVKTVLARAGVVVRPAAQARAMERETALLRDPGACDRCGIKLAEAPDGGGGVCGWCIEELGEGGAL